MLVVVARVGFVVVGVGVGLVDFFFFFVVVVVVVVVVVWWWRRLWLCVWL